MKINTTRKTKQYRAGDEVTAQIAECQDKNGNLGMKLFIIEDGKPGNTFFYHSYGAYQGKGSFFFEKLLDHLNVPEGIDIDEKWFVGKRLQVVLGERVSPTDGKAYLNIASYVNVENSSETKINPFINDSDLTADVPFELVDGVAFESPKPAKKKKGPPGETAIDARPDYTALLNE